MRRSASEMLSELENRVARLEKTSTNTYHPEPLAQLTFRDESGKVVDVRSLKGREITEAIKEYDLTDVTIQTQKKDPLIKCRRATPPSEYFPYSVEMTSSQEQFAVCMLRELAQGVKLNISN